MIDAVTREAAANKVAIKIRIRFLLIGLTKTSGRKFFDTDFITPTF
jgi:hypothetical protein